MFHRDDRFYPAVTFCFAIACIAFALGFALSAKADQIITKEGKIEKAFCLTYWSEPVTIVCRSQFQTCRYYPETGQMECIQE